NAEYSRFSRLQTGGSWQEFVQHASASRVGRSALAAWRASRAVLAFPRAKRASLKALLARHAGERVLVFTSDNATAYAIARELLVNPVTCDIGRRERADMLRRFRD